MNVPVILPQFFSLCIDLIEPDFKSFYQYIHPIEQYSYWFLLYIKTIFICWYLCCIAVHLRFSHPASPRYGQSRSTWAGGERLPHALPSGLSRVPPRDDEGLLEEGSGREADVRVHPVLFRRLLHGHRATVPAGRQPLEGLWSKLCHCRETHRQSSEQRSKSDAQRGCRD